jgi:anhydro-N-acetylmuramic acid kinase
MKNKFNVLGLMSGTSLDGLDVALCSFVIKDGKWKFTIVAAETVKYSARWKEALSNAHCLSAEKLLSLDMHYGNYIGTVCRDFLQKNDLRAEFIASHGHTVFHQPENGFTFQLGNGNAIHAATGLKVISDFRSLDVALKGQGAPLVPAGDHYLFGDYNICLNLGGIANISRLSNRKRIAYDICFCNMPLNYLMEKLGKSFDKGGERAASGTIVPALLKQLTALYRPLKRKRPSLARELFDNKIKPLLDDESVSHEDRLATCVESTAIEIADAVRSTGAVTMLCTGGGVYNSYLMSRILDHCGDNVSLIIPDDDVVKFKEAMIFAFLAVLRVLKKPNALAGVTGAVRDNCGGMIIGN